MDFDECYFDGLAKSINDDISFMKVIASWAQNLTFLPTLSYDAIVIESWERKTAIYRILMTMNWTEHGADISAHSQQQNPYNLWHWKCSEDVFFAWLNLPATG